MPRLLHPLAHACATWWRQRSIATMLVLSLAISIIFGTAALLLPGITVTGIRQPLIDALFMATSALCVTGLAVVDLGSAYTGFGQLVMLLLIQVGGIGIISLARLALLRFRQSRDPGTRELVTGTFGLLPRLQPVAVLRQAVIYTGTCELAGILLLAPSCIHRFGWGEGLWAALFHSVSAFCNAGFGLWPDNLAVFRDNLWVNLIIMALIVSGGLGFLVVADIIRWVRQRLGHGPCRISLHSRVVLATTALLLVGGTLAIWLLSRGADGPGAPGLLECAFLSTSARTAGFTTIDTALWSHPALLVVILLMIVGGSPGSTAGGIKTTSLAALMAVILSRHRNRPGIELFHRQIAAEVVAKALVSFAGMLAAILFGVLLLEVAESGLQPHAILGRQRFFDHLFEVVSALGTVGLSTGVTSTLGPAGRLILIVCMFLGRIGPLLVATSLIGHRRRVAMNYANEDILVG